MKKILLACGAGASSGFIAQKMRKAAKKMNLEMEIRAVSDTEIMENIDGVGVLLIGPHLKHKFEDIQSEVEGLGVKAMIIDRKYYSTLDGESVLKEALTLLQ
ncbi:MAG: PTS sugar transporter subunit IIB [Clostridium sp.]|nr:PTS sugar transporter subunit IIB [Clostridium sp.]